MFLEYYPMCSLLETHYFPAIQGNNLTYSNNVLLSQVLKITKRYVYSTVLFNFVHRQKKILQVQDYLKT
jgi:hypothetical protein